MRKLALLILSILAVSCAAKPTPTPEPIAFVELTGVLPTSTPEPSPTKSVRSVPPRFSPASPSDGQEVLDRTFAEVFTKSRYIIPLRLVLDEGETVYLTKIPGKRPVFFIGTSRKYETPDGVGIMTTYARVLDVEREGGKIVFYALESVPFVFANCSHYLVNRNSIGFEGVYRGVRVDWADIPNVHCQPLVDKPYRDDGAMTEDGYYALRAEWSEQRNSYRLTRARYSGDGRLVEEKPFRMEFIRWLAMTDTGLVCGVPTTLPSEMSGQEDLFCYQPDNADATSPDDRGFYNKPIVAIQAYNLMRGGDQP